MRFCACVFVLMGVAASAADVYVDGQAAAGGNGSSGAPFQTVGEAIDYVNHSSSGSLTVHIAPGDYVIAAPLSVTNSVKIVGTTLLQTTSKGFPRGAWWKAPQPACLRERHWMPETR